MIETVISSMIGQELISHAMNDTTKSIYAEVSYLAGYTNYNFKEILEELDIITKIEIITKLIEEQEQKHQLLIISSHSKCLKSLIDIIENINKEILEIRQLITEHETKWLYKWRASLYEPKVKNLIKHVKIMESRLGLFIQLININ
jgi:formyltetrahydrofolate hydrolase